MISPFGTGTISNGSGPISPSMGVIFVVQKRWRYGSELFVEVGSEKHDE